MNLGTHQKATDNKKHIMWFVGSVSVCVFMFLSGWYFLSLLFVCLFVVLFFVVVVVVCFVCCCCCCCLLLLFVKVEYKVSE